MLRCLPLAALTAYPTMAWLVVVLSFAKLLLVELWLAALYGFAAFVATLALLRSHHYKRLEHRFSPSHVTESVGYHGIRCAQTCQTGYMKTVKTPAHPAEECATRIAQNPTRRRAPEGIGVNKFDRIFQLQGSPEIQEDGYLTSDEAHRVLEVDLHRAMNALRDQLNDTSSVIGLTGYQGSSKAIRVSREARER
jgi:hypothetical protein